VRRLPLLILLALAAFAALVWAGGKGYGPLVVTQVDEQKLILVFGRPVSVLTQPGLTFRVPLISDVRTFDNRLLYFNAEPLPIQTRDEERIVVDNYVVWRILDPLQYFGSFPTGRAPAESQIDRVVRARVRQVIGQRTLAEVLTTARVDIMKEITEATNAGLKGTGIVIEDVRINRTELPKGTEQNVYARMRAERQRLSRQLRAEGEEQGRRIRADSEREALVLVSAAKRDADVLRGEGDAEAARIYAEAYSGNAPFSEFVRTLEAYRKVIPQGTTLVLPPGNDFFRLFETRSLREP
jgi:membrane protease subunit HflC